MGTHTYFLEITRDSPTQSYRTNDRRPTEGSWGPFLMNETAVRYISQFGCREVLVNNLWYFAGQIRGKAPDMFVGVRCFGEMYNHVYPILAKKGASKIVEEFLSKIFEFDIKITPVKIEDKTGTTFFGAFNAQYPEGNKKLSGTVSVMYKWNKKHPLVLSTILGLLKEPRIVSKIVSREIRGKTSLAKELMNISYDRLFGLDFSYKYSGYADRGKKNKKLFWKGILANLRRYGNTDASDFLSMFYTSIFIEFILEDLELILKMFRANDRTIRWNGPVDCIKSFFDEESREFLRWINKDRFFKVYGKTQKMNNLLSTLYLVSDRELSRNVAGRLVDETI